MGIAFMNGVHIFISCLAFFCMLVIAVFIAFGVIWLFEAIKLLIRKLRK